MSFWSPDRRFQTQPFAHGDYLSGEEIGIEYEDDVVLQIQYWIRNPTRRDILQARSEFAREVKSRFEAKDLTISPPAGRKLSGSVHVDQFAGEGTDQNVSSP